MSKMEVFVVQESIWDRKHDRPVTTPQLCLLSYPPAEKLALSISAKDHGVKFLEQHLEADRIVLGEDETVEGIRVEKWVVEISPGKPKPEFFYGIVVSKDKFSPVQVTHGFVDAELAKAAAQRLLPKGAKINHIEPGSGYRENVFVGHGNAEKPSEGLTVAVMRLPLETK
ncbi:hypothetical protein T439DRAFT_355912 [Meredithblackwellia eburnea MCA 4105]